MAFININIEKVVVESDPEVKTLLKQINKKLDDYKQNEATMKKVYDKLDKAIKDIKQTV